MKPFKRYCRRRLPVIAELRQERERQRLKREVLAETLGYHRMTVGRWERGETMPSFQALHDWCEALGVTLTIYRGIT